MQFFREPVGGFGEQGFVNFIRRIFMVDRILHRSYCRAIRKRDIVLLEEIKPGGINRNAHGKDSNYHQGDLCGVGHFFRKHFVIRSGKYRGKKFFQEMISSEYFRNSNQPSGNGKHREYYQGNGHRCRRFVQVMLLFFCPPEFSEESEIEQTEHIKCCEYSSDHSHQPEKFIISESVRKNFILGKKSGERRNSSYGDRGN